MSEIDQVERARKTAIQEAPLFALMAAVHPRRLPERLPVMSFGPPGGAVFLGERQGARFRRDPEAWSKYHGTLSRQLARRDVGYFLVVSRTDPPEFEPTAYLIDLSRWEPDDDLAGLLEPPREEGVRSIGSDDFYVVGPPGAEIQHRFKSRMPWWLRRLDRIVRRGENRRRAYDLSEQMAEENDDAPPPELPSG